jgi:hypothetical protein
MREYGAINFRVDHIASAVTIKELASLEGDLIDQFKPTYNVIAKPDNIWSKPSRRRGPYY